MNIRKRGSEHFQTALASLCLRVQSPKDLTRPFINVLAHNHGRAHIIDATETTQSVCEHRAKIERVMGLRRLDSARKTRFLCLDTWRAS